MKHLTENERVIISKFGAALSLQLFAGLTAEDSIYVRTKDAASIHAGMQVLYFDGLYEVSQYQAGPKANELHIYTKTTKLLTALQSLVKGNRGRKTIEKF